MIENLIFDLGGVLFDEHNGTIVEPMRKAAASEGQFMAMWTNIMLGRITMRECYDILIRQNKANEEILASTMSYDFCLENLPPRQNMIEAVKALSRNYNVFILSNATDTMRDYTSKQLAFLDDAHKIYSCDAGMMKPDLRLFRFVLNSFGLNPEKTAFFDDHQKNLCAAELCGIKPILVVSDFRPDIPTILNTITTT